MNIKNKKIERIGVLPTITYPDLATIIGGCFKSSEEKLSNKKPQPVHITYRWRERFKSFDLTLRLLLK